MNKIIKYFLTISILTISLMYSSNIKINAADEDPVISFTCTEINDKEFNVVTKLVKNSGILAMNVNLIYDTNAMTLQSLTYGEALKSLNPISTNVETDKGYSIYPFVISYEGRENDYSTGILFSMVFKVKDNYVDGDYTISLKYKKNESVTCLTNAELITKNLLIDKVNITLKNNESMKISIISPEDENIKNNTVLYICIGCLSTIALVVIIYFICKKKRKKEKWIKL